MKILHITNWYPNKGNPKEALWISNHVEALNAYAQNDVVHLRVLGGRRFGWERTSDHKAEHVILSIPVNTWFVIEILSTILLVGVLTRKQANKKYDLINFHIVYPNLTYWHWIKKWIKIPALITEHWSAYHFNFGVKKKLPRAQRIFQQGIPVIAVSNSLIQDIKKFSQAEFPSYVVPNVVDTRVFRCDESIKREPGRFFMVSQWKWPKRPAVVIDAFKELIKENPSAKLVIGGYGEGWPDIQEAAEGFKQIELIGQLNADQIAKEMNQAQAFIHMSEYETFSVVCAEAICCGCLVIASNVGGIPEFINAGNGVLVEENNEKSFMKAMSSALLHTVSVGQVPDFSMTQVGLLYFEVINKVLNGANQ